MSSVCLLTMLNRKEQGGHRVETLERSFFSQVESMSIELEEAKTKVAQFQKQCEEYLVVIVQQKRDADEQQKVSSFRGILIKIIVNLGRLG